MQNGLSAKFFHTIVVLGIGMTGSGCSDDSTPTPSNTSTSSTSSSTGGAVVADGGSSSSSSSSGDTIPSWSCC